MKTKLLIYFMATVFLFANICFAAEGKTAEPAGQSDNIAATVMSTPELENLARIWVNDYMGFKHAGDFGVSYRTEGMPEDNTIFFTDNKETDQLTQKITVGHEIFVPVMNANNPLTAKLKAEGLNATDFKRLLSGSVTWDQVKEGVEKVPVQILVSDNKKLMPALAAFSGLDIAAVEVTKTTTVEEMLNDVAGNINAVGFCRLSDIVVPETGNFKAGLFIIPLDKNQNGKIDRFENVYDSPVALARGAWIGKYPAKLHHEVYAAFNPAIQESAANDFLMWILDKGQMPLVSQGFSNISSREKAMGIQVLNPGSASDIVPSVDNGRVNWYLVTAGLALILILYLAIRTLRSPAKGIQGEDIQITAALNVNSIQAPAGLFYDKTHTWAFMEQNGLVKIGIDDFLPHVTGNLSQVKMRNAGEKVRKGEKIISIVKEGKQLDLYSPVTGVIGTVNESLLDNPSQINTDPYKTGWVYQIEPSNWLRETKFMFMADRFRDWLDDEYTRLKDFLAASANTNSTVYNHVVLQDGGELTDQVLAGLGPEVWEDFQNHFIDVSR